MNFRVTNTNITPLLIYLGLSTVTEAWSPAKFQSLSSLQNVASPIRTVDTALNVGATWNLQPGENEEEDYNSVLSSDYMMSRAQVCADSESCSLEEAQHCLDELLHVQMQCIGSGVLSTSAICDIDTVDTVDTVTDIVAKLRNKIQEESKRLVWVKAGMNIANLVLGIMIVSMILHGIAADPHVPVDSMATPGLVENDPNRAVVPFLPIEWIWAARDGYLPLMVSQWFQHGGLVVDATAYDVKAVPFTPQEWIWSIQNGSFGNLLQENMKYGALRVDSMYDSETVPLEAKELWWALSGGYGDDVLHHFFRNGGL